jgi:hypothetical protein
MTFSGPSLHTRLLALGAVAALVALAGCGKSDQQGAQALAPVSKQGAVSVVTRNTSRIGGYEAAGDAAAVARAVYPGLTSASEPQALVLVDEHDWSAALAASVLAGAPAAAPILYARGSALPALTQEAIEQLHPRGLSALGGVQVIRVGALASVPHGLSARTLPAGEPAVVGEEVEGLLRSLTGAPPRQVIVVPVAAPRAMTMPVAGLAAQSGAPILFTEATRVPAATVRVLRSIHDPSIYVVDPAALEPAALSVLHRLGRVTRIAASAASTSAGAVANAIAIARYTDGSFGWGIREPGHGLVFANQGRPLDGPAAALLSANADYGPLLLLESTHGISPALVSYLSDIQPAYTSQPAYRPVRGVYNHGWLIGDESALSAVTQAELDSLLEISPSSQNGEEAQSEQNG